MNATEQLNKKYIVGVTGGIGCGKTTVTNLFLEKGIEVVDADVVAREVVEPNSQGLLALVDAFGSNILNSDSTLNRGCLREIVFTDETAKSTVNNILHPLIRNSMFEQLINTLSVYCILSAPLLFENQLQQFVSTTLVVDITPQQQLSRTLSRDGGNAKTIEGIMAAQINRDERLALADDIIDNSKSLDLLAPQVARLHQKYMTLSSQVLDS